MKYGIIGGTGVYAIENKGTEKTIKTPYGSIDIYVVELAGDEIIFLPRHGKGHKLPPHKINYKGNIWALKEYGVEKILATAAVGSLREDIKVGDLIVIEDFLDFTQGREGTFFEGGKVAHVSMADPYCSTLRARLKEKGLEREGIYVCTQGPRFETGAEIRFYAHIGGDVVGMTNVPEVVLAKELGLCYACVGIVTNMATGLAEETTGQEILTIVEKRKEELTKIFIEIFQEKKLQDCNCQEALIEV